MPDTGWNDDALVRRIDMVDFLKEAEGIEQEVIGWRRHVHQYPELLMDLPETAAFVERELKNMGYEPEYICQSGIVAVLDSQKPGKTLLLRADMDALPIGEESGLEYASKHPGISHACGHDTHIAMLLGAAKLLMKHKDLLRGKVKFMFQPGSRILLETMVIFLLCSTLTKPFSEVLRKAGTIAKKSHLTTTSAAVLRHRPKWGISDSFPILSRIMTSLAVSVTIFQKVIAVIQAKKCWRH